MADRIPLHVRDITRSEREEESESECIRSSPAIFQSSMLDFVRDVARSLEDDGRGEIRKKGRSRLHQWRWQWLELVPSVGGNQLGSPPMLFIGSCQWSRKKKEVTGVAL